MKSMYTSKTFWVNVLSALIAVLALPEIAMLPSHWLPYIGGVTAVLNVFLRTLTTEPATFKMGNVSRLPVWFLLLTVAGIASGCVATMRAGYSPEATAAFRNTRVIKGLDLLRDTAIDANAENPPLLSTETTRKVVLFHQSTLKIIAATEDGWVEAAKQSLRELADNVPPNERGLLGPYLGLTKTLLAEEVR